MAEVNAERIAEVMKQMADDLRTRATDIDRHAQALLQSGLWLVVDGYMRHCRDASGLLGYLQTVGLAHARSSLTVQG